MSSDSCGPIEQFMPTMSAPASASCESASDASPPNGVLPSARNVIDARTGIALSSARAVRAPRVRGDELGVGGGVVVVDLLDERGVRQGERGARAVGRSAARDEERPVRPVGEEDFGLEPLANVFLHETKPPSTTKGRK